MNPPPNTPTHFKHTYSIVIATSEAVLEVLFWVFSCALMASLNFWINLKHLSFKITLTLWKSQKLSKAIYIQRVRWVPIHGNIFHKSTFPLKSYCSRIHWIFFITYPENTPDKRLLEFSSESSKNNGIYVERRGRILRRLNGNVLFYSNIFWIKHSNTLITTSKYYP